MGWEETPWTLLKSSCYYKILGTLLLIQYVRTIKIREQVTLNGMLNIQYLLSF